MIQREPEADAVVALLDRSAISTVNWSEVCQKAIARDLNVDGLRAEMAALGLAFIPFGAEEAEIAAGLWKRTRALGLSLGDRACLATGLRERARVLTLERSWSRLDIGVSVEVLRTSRSR